MELGPGTRVWIGWTPDHRVQGRGKNARCNNGTVKTYLGYNPFTNDVEWGVEVDDIGYVEVAEHLLHPIDGGNPVKEEQHRVETVW